MNTEYLLAELDDIDEFSYRDSRVIGHIKSFVNVLSNHIVYIADYSSYAKENTYQDIVNGNITNSIDVGRIYQQYYLDALISALRDKIDIIAKELVV
jgi:hypothetical protein